MHRYILAVLLALFSVLLPETAAAQTRTLTGKVIDENNEPLIGATVAVSPTEGTITNLD